MLDAQFYSKYILRVKGMKEIAGTRPALYRCIFLNRGQVDDDDITNTHEYCIYIDTVNLCNLNN